MGLINRESRVWNATGIKPASGDEIYSAGEQPIAGYDNWAMWSATNDIKSLNDALGNHSDRHEADGADELDLDGMSIGGITDLSALNDEFHLLDAVTEDSIIRIDVDDDVVRAFPRFGLELAAGEGIEIGDDIVRRDNGDIFYNYDTGRVPEAEWAADADHADTADYADDSDTVDGYHASEFVQPADAVTWTNDHEYTETVDADISGNAATADHADDADTADYATEAGNSDTVDGYHAQELIDSVDTEGEWNTIAETEHDTDGDRWTWFHESSTTYDQYKLDIYMENHRNSGTHPYIWLQVGKGGTVDQRDRYNYRKRNIGYNKPYQNYINHEKPHGWPVAFGQLDTASMHTHFVSCPRPVVAPDKHYPVLDTVADGVGVHAPYVKTWGSLHTNFNTIDTFRLASYDTRSTGKAVLKGKNFG